MDCDKCGEEVNHLVGTLHVNDEGELACMYLCDSCENKRGE